MTADNLLSTASSPRRRSIHLTEGNGLVWASVDPATTSGVAFWRGSKLLGTGVVRPIGKGGKYRTCRALCGEVEHFDTPNRWTAWCILVLSCLGGIVVEEGCGKFVSAVKSQANLRGYLEAVCEHTALEFSASWPFHTVNVSEWRRVIREQYGVSWPKRREGCKALALTLATKLTGLTVTEDEADAILLGLSAQRMGMMACVDILAGK